MPASMTPGQIIREARLAHGLSLGQLASAVGRTASSVRRWEKDDAVPGPAVLDQLAELLDIDRSVLEQSPDSDETSATGGEATVDVPAVEGDDAPNAALGEILGDGAVGEEDDRSDHAVEVVMVSTPDEVIPSETATPAGVPAAATIPVPVQPAAKPETATAGGALETATTEEAAVPVDVAGTERASASGVDPAAATVPVAVPPPAASAPPRAPQAEHAAVEPPKTDTDTEGLIFPVPPPEAAVRPAEPPAPSWWQHPLRWLRQGDQQWRYYLRGALTVIVLVLLAWGLVWAFGELSEALGDLWDTFGRSSDTVDARAGLEVNAR